MLDKIQWLSALRVSISYVRFYETSHQKTFHQTLGTTSGESDIPKGALNSDVTASILLLRNEFDVGKEKLSYLETSEDKHHSSFRLTFRK